MKCSKWSCLRKEAEKVLYQFHSFIPGCSWRWGDILKTHQKNMETKRSTFVTYRGSSMFCFDLPEDGKYYTSSRCRHAFLEKQLGVLETNCCEKIYWTTKNAWGRTIVASSKKKKASQAEEIGEMTEWHKRTKLVKMSFVSLELRNRFPADVVSGLLDKLQLPQRPKKATQVLQRGQFLSLPWDNSKRRCLFEISYWGTKASISNELAVLSRERCCLTQAHIWDILENVSGLLKVTEE